MKICVITECLAGGVLTYLQNVCNFMAETGEEIILIYSPKDETPDNVKLMFNKNIKLVELQFNRKKIGSYFKLYYEYKRLIKEIGPDVIHLHSSFSGYIGRVLLKFNPDLCNKSFYTPHGYSFLKLNNSNSIRRLFMNLEKYISFFNPNTIIVPISDSEESASNLIAHKRNIKKVLTGININNIDLLTTGIKKNDSKIKYVISTGRLSDQKNPLMFIEIAKQCIEKRKDLKFIWIGGGKLEGVVRDKVKEYSLEKHVTITGWINHDEAIKLMYKYGDIYVQTSLWEGLPITVLEAMYLRSCVLVKNSPGNTDPIENQKNGFIFSQVNEFAEEIIGLLEREESSLKIARCAHGYVKENYNIEINSQKLLSLYYE